VGEKTRETECVEGGSGRQTRTSTPKAHRSHGVNSQRQYEGTKNFPYSRQQHRAAAAIWVCGDTGNHGETNVEARENVGEVGEGNALHRQGNEMGACSAGEMKAEQNERLVGRRGETRVF